MVASVFSHGPAHSRMFHVEHSEDSTHATEVQRQAAALEKRMADKAVELKDEIEGYLTPMIRKIAEQEFFTVLQKAKGAV